LAAGALIAAAREMTLPQLLSGRCDRGHALDLREQTV